MTQLNETTRNLAVIYANENNVWDESTRDFEFVRGNIDEMSYALPLQKAEEILKEINEERISKGVEEAYLIEIPIDLEMEKLENLKNEKIVDNNHPDGILVSELAEHIPTGELYYKLSTASFGYGDDARDFENRNEDYIIIEELYLENDGSITIFYE